MPNSFLLINRIPFSSNKSLTSLQWRSIKFLSMTLATFHVLFLTCWSLCNLETALSTQKILNQLPDTLPSSSSLHSPQSLLINNNSNYLSTTMYQLLLRYHILSSQWGGNCYSSFTGEETEASRFKQRAQASSASDGWSWDPGLSDASATSILIPWCHSRPGTHAWPFYLGHEPLLQESPWLSFLPAVLTYAKWDWYGTHQTQVSLKFLVCGLLLGA